MPEFASVQIPGTPAGADSPPPVGAGSGRFNRLALVIALLLPLGFAFYTGEIWEDFFITYRHSENLAQGRGLVYTAGERVHGFTSVLNTLLPAFFAWITGATDHGLPLLLYQGVSLAGLFVALASVSRIIGDGVPRNRLTWYLCALFPVCAVLESKITAFTMNGQEAGLMLAFVALTFTQAYRGWPREQCVAGGACLAGLMYTRPDGFVYAAAIAASALVFSGEPRRPFLRSFARSAALGALLYLPWLIFTHSYYGTIIPHTIVAKQGTEFHPNPAFGLFAPVASGLAKLPERLCGTLLAIYDYYHTGPGTWPSWIRDLAFLLEGIAVTYWLIPTRDRLGRTASFCAFLILGYLTYASLIAYSCPWYYPPLSFLSILCLLRVSAHLPALAFRPLAALPAVALVAALLLQLGFVFAYSLPALRLKQEVVDMGQRREIGLWLRAHVAEGETVYLEPLGYIGYFSQCRIRDWPGLVAPEVVAARRKIGRIPYPWGNYLWAKVAEEIQPDWIVARPTEVAQLRASARLSQDYSLVKVFDASEQILAAGDFPGSAVTYGDAVFALYHRLAPTPRKD